MHLHICIATTNKNEILNDLRNVANDALNYFLKAEMRFCLVKVGKTNVRVVRNNRDAVCLKIGF